jgi:hypothetical protein
MKVFSSKSADRPSFSPKIIAILAVACGIVWVYRLWRDERDRAPLKLNLPPRKIVLPNSLGDYATAADALNDKPALSNALRSRLVPGPEASRRRAGSARHAFASPQEAKKIVRDNREALRRLRKALAGEYWAAPFRDAFSRSLDYSDIRLLARLLVLEGRVRAAGGDWRGAADSDLDAIRLGLQVQRGETLLGRIVGEGCEGLGQNALRPAIEHLDGPSAIRTASRLQQLLLERPSFADAMKEEKRFYLLSTLQDLKRRDAWGKPVRSAEGEGLAPETPGEKALEEKIRRDGKQKALDDIAAYMDRIIAETSRPFSRRSSQSYDPPAPFDSASTTLFEQAWTSALARQARTALLAALSGLHAYRMRHSSYPAKLQELVPRYLRSVPEDPFADRRPLLYRKSGASFLLYSVGPDGRDNGGTPIDNALSTPGRPMNPSERRRIRLESRGDMVADVNAFSRPSGSFLSDSSSS